MNELTISLDPRRKIPLYEQIYGFIREEIRGGRIHAGERLPSARALAGYLSVSRSTVDLAYEQLVSEGYLESEPCKGYFVCEIEGLYRLDEKKEETKEAAAREQPSFRYDFAVTGTAPGGFPQNIWKKISKEVLLDADDSLFQLGDAKGEHGLREAIRDYLHHARGVNCRTEQIIVGAGNDYLLMLLSVILKKGHKVAMENPTYISAYHCFQKLGYEMCTISMDEAGMRPAELEKSGADLAYIMPSHQFPMGMVMPMKRRMQLLAWASRKAGRYLIEDDYDSEFRYKGRPIPALQGNDPKGNVIYLGTFSRAIAPSIRISYMVLPETLLPAYEENGRCFSATVSKTDQKILEEFMRSGAFERHLNRMRAQYKGKHDLLIRLLKELGKEYTVSGENAGVHVLVHLPKELSEAEAVQRAGDAGVHVYGLEQYCVGSAVNPARGGTILLGYAGLSEEEIAAAAAILKQCWNA